MRRRERTYVVISRKIRGGLGWFIYTLFITVSELVCWALESMRVHLPPLGCALAIEVLCDSVILGASFLLSQMPFGCRGRSFCKSRYSPTND